MAANFGNINSKNINSVGTALQTEGALGRNLDPNDLTVTIAYLDME